MNNPNPEDQARRIKEAIFSGQKIQAIKFYREQTGSDLADAKAAVEKLESELRASSPEHFTKTAKAGCASVIVAGTFVIFWRFLA